jgi:hypothetical protein
MGSDASKSKKHATQLTEEEIQLLLKNTHFNRQQIMEWHQGFLVSFHLDNLVHLIVQLFFKIN